MCSGSASQACSAQLQVLLVLDSLCASCFARWCVLRSAATGAGRRVGENCEHLWAELRPTFGLTRYMTTDKYISTLEDVLLQVSEDKMRSYVTFMERQARAAVKKLGEYAVSCTCRPFRGTVLLCTHSPRSLHNSVLCARCCAASLHHREDHCHDLGDRPLGS